MNAFTAAELARLPKWAMVKVLTLQESEQALRQTQMGHHEQAIVAAAKTLVLILGQRAVTSTDLGKAQLDLTLAVQGWEDWAVDQKFAGNGS